MGLQERGLPWETKPSRMSARPRPKALAHDRLPTHSCGEWPRTPLTGLWRVTPPPAPALVRDPAPPHAALAREPRGVLGRCRPLFALHSLLNLVF